MATCWSKTTYRTFHLWTALRENIKLIWYSNPAFPKGGPKIEGTVAYGLCYQRPELDRSTDLLSASEWGYGDRDRDFYSWGSRAGESIGTDMWTSHKLPPTGWKNIKDILKHPIPDGGVIYGVLYLFYSPREQNTTNVRW